MDDRFRFKIWDRAKKEMKFIVLKDEKITLQCTGLKDKSGKDIYESDIIYFDNEMTADDSLWILPNGWTFTEENKFEIIWDDKMVGWRIKDDVDRSDIVKEFGDETERYVQKYLNHAMMLMIDGKAMVAGNIYESPKLLKS